MIIQRAHALVENSLRGEFLLAVDESKSGATLANCRVAQLIEPVSSSLVTRLRRCYRVSF